VGIHKRTVLATLMDNTAYPLLDSKTGQLVNSLYDLLNSMGVKDPGLSTSMNGARSRGKQTLLNQALLAGVPQFPMATLDMILDIRTELQEHLTAYRSAVIGFSREVESIPWSDTFSTEVDELYRLRVAPQVEALSEAVERNGELRVLARGMAEDPKAWMASVALVALAVQGDLLSAIGDPAAPTFLAGLAGTTMPFLFKCLNERKERELELRRNPLYLLSQIHRVLPE